MVEAINVTKNYGDKRALDDISFSIGSGQVVGLLGLNGAGKTTTMNILTGYIAASNGKVRIGGYDIIADGAKAKGITGYLPEQPSFYPEMRVDEHLNFICDLKGIRKNRKIREEHVHTICTRVGIADVRRRLVRNLSKGYRQRVGFAQALIGDPKVLILDEPTAGLDPSQIIEIRKLIKECGKKSTVIVSSHILYEIGTVCDRVIVIDKGRLIADGSPSDLTAGKENADTYTVRIKGKTEHVIKTLSCIESIKSVKCISDTITNGNTAEHDYMVTGREYCDFREDMWRALVKEDLPILSSFNSAASLEDIFLRLTKGREVPQS